MKTTKGTTQADARKTGKTLQEAIAEGEVTLADWVTSMRETEAAALSLKAIIEAVVAEAEAAISTARQDTPN